MSSLDIKWTNLERVLNDFAYRFIELARQNLNDNNSNASHELYNSLEKIVEIGEDSFSVKISLADYWQFLEHGRGPGKFPPPPAIRNWIEVKPVQPYPDSRGRIPTVDQLTFLIGRKIAEEGTEPQPFFEPAKEQAVREFSTAIDKAIEADVDEYVEECVVKMLETWLGKK
jgi:hypothetical protein